MRKVGGHVSVSGGIKNAVKNTLSIGGNCFQFFAGSPRVWARSLYSGVEVEEFKNLVKAHSLEPHFIHALYLVNLASNDPGILEKSINSLHFDLQNSVALGSAGVIVHIGSHQGRGFDSVKAQILKIIYDLLSANPQATLILENDAGQQGKIGSLEEISWLIQNCKNPRLKFCLDTAHLFESGVDLNDKDAIIKFIQDIDHFDLTDHLVCIHLNDSRTKLHSHRDMHANLGEGEIGLDGLKQFINYPSLSSVPLILEVPGKDHTGPDKQNINIAKSLVS